MDLQQRDFNYRYRSPIKLRYVLLAMMLCCTTVMLLQHRPALVTLKDRVLATIKHQAKPVKTGSDSPGSSAELVSQNLTYYDLLTQPDQQVVDQVHAVYLLRFEQDLTEKEQDQITQLVEEKGLKTFVKVVDLEQARNITRVDIGPIFSLNQASSIKNDLKVLKKNLKLVKYPIDLSKIEWHKQQSYLQETS